jgi:YebC/PmpR family DNA-binding regulatory protein
MGRAANVRKETKARTDAAKSKNNGRYAKKIIVAVKAGGPDPVSNRLLAQVIAEAKVANVPKDIISRNIEKASSSTAEDYKESVFEFYGHGGAGLIVSVLTDNDNRAAAGINLVVKKHALKPAAINSVRFKFNTKARLTIHSKISEDELMDLCLEHGVDDYSLFTESDGGNLSPEEDGHSNVYVDPKEMVKLRDALLTSKYTVDAKMVSVPIEGFLKLPNDEVQANLAAIEAFEELDDIDMVEHNMDLTTI